MYAERRPSYACRRAWANEKMGEQRRRQQHARAGKRASAGGKKSKARARRLGMVVEEASRGVCSVVYMESFSSTTIYTLRLCKRTPHTRPLHTMSAEVPAANDDVYTGAIGIGACVERGGKEERGGG